MIPYSARIADFSREEPRLPGRLRPFVMWSTALLLILSPASIWAAADPGSVTDLRAIHRAGQTFITWRESFDSTEPETATVREISAARSGLERNRTMYRIYTSVRPIVSLDGLRPMAEVRPLNGWNTAFYGAYAPAESVARRYVIEQGPVPVTASAGLYIHNPAAARVAYYAVTAVVAGEERRTLTSSNSLSRPVSETVGPGIPVLQRIEKPASFTYVRNPALHYYVRWEMPPNTNEPGRPFDYLVAIPEQIRNPAPVGIHLHGWGGNLNRGYGWWYDASDGAILVSSNEYPYDWWTGYHEQFGVGRPLKTPQDWQAGIVHSYSQTRMLSFLAWVATKYPVDLSRVFAAGNSMGGTGALMLAIRHPDRIAWAIGWVGVHRPRESPAFHGSFERVYGKPAWNVRFEDGSPVWDYFDDVWYLRKHPDRSIGFLTFSNGKNDDGIGWPQAVDFLKALQETRQPHLFVWGQAGHGQRATMPAGGGESYMPLDLRTDQSLPAFTACSLDQNAGNGDPADGDPKGQVNAYLSWDTKDVVDEPGLWEMTIRLTENAPAATALVDVTPRRTQRFRPRPKTLLDWSVSAVGGTKQHGMLEADEWSRATVPGVQVTKRGVRLRIKGRSQ